MAKKPVSKVKPRIFKPADFLRGSMAVGKDYTAWSTYGQGKPDFGKGGGPGEPYHEVTRRNTGKNYVPTQKPSVGTPNPSYRLPRYNEARQAVDPRTAAIRRRLGWM